VAPREKSLVTPGLNCAKKNHPPHHYTTTTRLHRGNKAWRFSFCLHQILTLPSECLNRYRDSDQANLNSLQLSNFGELVQIVASFFLLVVEMSGTRWGLLFFCSPSASRLCFTNACHVIGWLDNSINEKLNRCS